MLRKAISLLILSFVLVGSGCAIDGGMDGGGAGMAGTAGAAGALGGSAGSSVVGGTGSGGSPAGGASAGAVGPGGAGAGGTGGTLGGGAGGAVGGAGLGGGGAAGASSGNGGVGGVGALGGNGGAPGGRGGTAGAGAGGRGGSGNAGGGNAGSGGSTGFNPCPATGACKILPFGDSITDGLGFNGGYRVSLFSRAVAAGKTITFVGRSMNGPTMVSGQTFPRSHEGHSGWTIAQLDGITPDPALDPVPHIVLLHIGTNDVSSMGSGAPARLGALIDQIVADLPNALVVVAKIIPFPAASNQVNTFNAAIPALVEQRASAGKHVILVDQFTGFPTGTPTNELGDGVHPNEAGYTRMAGVWFTAISSYLH